MEKVDKEEKLDYIFGNHPAQPVQNRFGWLDAALLGDIQTFVDGIKIILSTTARSSIDDVHGGGNLSIPILVCTGLELVSALYVGKTKYKSGSEYDATENVEKFINRFFPNHGKKIPRLLWDGVRNGVDHLFNPKPFQYSHRRILFTFYVQDNRVPSCVTKSKGLVTIKINSIEFYLVLKQAINNYRIELTNDEELQCHFISAWKSIENHVQEIASNKKTSSELEYLLNELKHSDILKLFQ
jgi:hypothetical protein